MEETVDPSDAYTTGLGADRGGVASAKQLTRVWSAWESGFCVARNCSVPEP